ncbi:MAG: flagellar biosynthesis protein FliQ [Bacillota bacterium]
MSQGEIMDIMYSGVMVAIKLGGPLLLLSMAVGVTVSIIQAATQIHEQTLTFVPKVACITAICIISGSWMAATMTDYTYRIFDIIAR